MDSNVDYGEMTLGWLQEAWAVDRAIEEFQRIGRRAFLAKYGFREAREYYLRHDGYDFDSKAIAGAAVGYQYPDRGPLAYDTFTGGAAVETKLGDLGFTVHRTRRPQLPPEPDHQGRTSGALLNGALYTREELRAVFEVTDETINTGVFRPAGTCSVWLFVTEEKTKDRTQYRDRLEGDLLYWQGQTQARTDPLIIEHALRGLELLVFFRKRKYEHAGAAFRFLGPFEYVSHRAGKPSSFTLRRVGSEEGDTPEPAELDPDDVKDDRQRAVRAIAVRRGQRRFRNALLAAYDNRCCITGCAADAVLEAAHIHPYRGDRTNVVTNGLLLRSDIHTLFDLFLIGINPENFRIVITPQLLGTEYEALAGEHIRLPTDPRHRPGKTVLTRHLERMSL